MITFKSLTVKEVETILAGLMELPKKLSDELHAKLHADATAQYQAVVKATEQTAPAEATNETIPTAQS